MATLTEYTVSLRKGPLHAEETVREHKASDIDGAENFIDSLRDYVAQREHVKWQSEDVNAEGRMYGLAPGGIVYSILVHPPLGSL